MLDSNTKKLSPAQAAHLKILQIGFQSAQRELSNFLAYLGDELGDPGTKYEVRDGYLVPVKPQVVTRIEKA